MHFSLTAKKTNGFIEQLKKAFACCLLVIGARKMDRRGKEGDSANYFKSLSYCSFLYEQGKARYNPRRLPPDEFKNGGKLMNKWAFCPFFVCAICVFLKLD